MINAENFHGLINGDLRSVQRIMSMGLIPICHARKLGRQFLHIRLLSSLVVLEVSKRLTDTLSKNCINESEIKVKV
jgi:hypothetical protein